MAQDIDLFPKQRVAGVFRGFTEGGLEFHADLILPYQSRFQDIPMHGQFLLVQLATPDEAVLGRISSMSAEGRLSSGQGDEFAIRAMQEARPIPEDLREQYVRYRVNIRVLGAVRKVNGAVHFVPSQRRLPHVGSLVAFPSEEVLQEIAGHNDPGVPLGFYALGEFVWGAQNPAFRPRDWTQVMNPEVMVNFDLTQLISRRTFIFARAGFGKSNVNKLLFSQLYRTTPMKDCKRRKQVPVGTLLFDPEGEYFWPDATGRPGLCDVLHLREQLVVFTSREPPGDFYGSFVVGEVKLDLRRFRPSDVISIALSPDRQEQQNVRKLKGLNQEKWSRLVEIIDRYGNDADLAEIGKVLSLEPSQEVEALAARGNMTAVVRMFHSRTSQFMDLLMAALSDGKLCVVDMSQMRGSQALVFSGLVLRRIFDRNQEEFTSRDARMIPTIAVVEEAQSVLVESKLGSEPFISWVKEGRKYELGGVFITQQPGSIPVEILSQGDNWFVFHLLSAADLTSLKRANAHFSNDILSSLLNEPIPGQGVFWSSAGKRAYPIPLNTLSFESMYRVDEKAAGGPAVDTYASRLKRRFKQVLREAQTEFERENEYPKGASVPLVAKDASTTKSTLTEESGKVREDITSRDAAQRRVVTPGEGRNSTTSGPRRSVEPPAVESVPVLRAPGPDSIPRTEATSAESRAGVAEMEAETREGYREEEGVDVLNLYKARAIQKVRQRKTLMARLRTETGLAWGHLKSLIRDELPETLEDRDDVAYSLVVPLLNEELGVGSWDDHKVQRGDRLVTYARAKS
ncbi:MAG: ATP-binding protein [Bacillota bacterium]|jgi:hypothetical protein